MTPAPPQPEREALTEEQQAFAAALNEDTAGVISAIGFWDEERLERLSAAAQLLDEQCLHFLDAHDAALSAHPKTEEPK